MHLVRTRYRFNVMLGVLLYVSIELFPRVFGEQAEHVAFHVQGARDFREYFCVRTSYVNNAHDVSPRYEDYYQRFQRIFRPSQPVPTYYIPGNHDVGLVFGARALCYASTHLTHLDSRAGRSAYLLTPPSGMRPTSGL